MASELSHTSLVLPPSHRYKSMAVNNLPFFDSLPIFFDFLPSAFFHAFRALRRRLPGLHRCRQCYPEASPIAPASRQDPGFACRHSPSRIGKTQKHRRLLPPCTVALLAGACAGLKKSGAGCTKRSAPFVWTFGHHHPGGWAACFPHFMGAYDLMLRRYCLRPPRQAAGCRLRRAGRGPRLVPGHGGPFFFLPA